MINHHDCREVIRSGVGGELKMIQIKSEIEL